MVVFSKFISSVRGGQILVDTDGYLYLKKRAGNIHDVYLCKKNSHSKKIVADLLTCPATLLMTDPENLTLQTPHNHEPTPGEAECLELKSGIKRKAADQLLTPTQNIVSEVLSQAHDTDHLLPKWASLQKIARRARAEPDPSPCSKKSHRAGYVLPDFCTVTTDNKTFLIYDNPGSEDRIMAWATNKNISYLKSACIIICDGNFSITPAPFFQPYSFHVGFAPNKTLPMLYSLLPDKTKATLLILRIF